MPSITAADDSRGPGVAAAATKARTGAAGATVDIAAALWEGAKHRFTVVHMMPLPWNQLLPWVENQIQLQSVRVSSWRGAPFGHSSRGLLVHLSEQVGS